MAIALGKCFSWAWKRIVELDNRDARLVHARVRFPWPPEGGDMLLHAWLEYDGKVYDWQNVVMRKPQAQTVEAFYEIWKPEQVESYSVRQALEMYRRHRHTGPWSRHAR
jgi:hypothetical protein